MAGSATITADFRDEYEVELARRLRRRVLWYAGVTIGFTGALLLLSLAFVVLLQLNATVSRAQFLSFIVSLFAGLISTGLYIWAFVHVRRQRLARETILRLVFWLIVITGTLGLISSVVGTEVGIRAAVAETHASLDEFRKARGLVSLQGMVSIAFTHLFACLFLPWTPRESIRPMLPLLGVNTVIALLYVPVNWVASVIVIFSSPLFFVPGVLICAWRASRFRERFHYSALRGRYGEMKQELVGARRIHESLFPEPITDGPVRVEYRYEPMRQIGGDFLFVRTATLPGKALPISNIVLIDVTGHGISAALTVNRLAGEIEREYGVDPARSPGRLLTGLNEYIHHTLAIHSVYATALCMRVDPNEDRIEWASAGHPPAFLRAVDGTIHRLESTSLVLGAAHGDDFVPSPRTARFGPGDVVLAYTDGATEACNADGRMLRVDGVQRVLAGGHPARDGGWAESVMRSVEDFREGPARDDTLLVEVYRPIALAETG